MFLDKADVAFPLASPLRGKAETGALFLVFPDEIPRPISGVWTS